MIQISTTITELLRERFLHKTLNGFANSNQKWVVSLEPVFEENYPITVYVMDVKYEENLDGLLTENLVLTVKAPWYNRLAEIVVTPTTPLLFNIFD